MDYFWIVAFIVGGFVIVVLSILLLRGRFGTPQEQADYEMRELLHSDDIPSEAHRRVIATCRGHDAGKHQMFGVGVLWASDDALGFVLRTPRRHLRIARSEIDGARASSSYSRVGVEESLETEEFLIVDWISDNRPAQIVFRLHDPRPWVEELAPVHP